MPVHLKLYEEAEVEFVMCDKIFSFFDFPVSNPCFGFRAGRMTRFIQTAESSVQTAKALSSLIELNDDNKLVIPLKRKIQIVIAYKSRPLSARFVLVVHRYLLTGAYL